jgi:hypothetical protein
MNNKMPSQFMNTSGSGSGSGSGRLSPAQLAKMKSMMIGRAKSINGDVTNVYFPPVSE